MNKFFSAALATTLLVGTLTTAIGSNSLAAPRVASSNNNSGDRSHTVNCYLQKIRPDWELILWITILQT